jgi:hypothetical protein
VVAVALLALAMIFILNMLPTSAFSLKHAEDLQAATAYGQSWIEDVRQNPPGVDRTADVLLNHTIFHVVRTVHAIPPDLVDVVVSLRSDTSNVPVQVATRLYVPVQTTP